MQKILNSFRLLSIRNFPKISEILQDIDRFPSQISLVEVVRASRQRLNRILGEVRVVGGGTYRQAEILLYRCIRTGAGHKRGIGI